MSATMLAPAALAHWAGVRAGTLQLLDAFGTDELRFVPFDGAWPVGRIFLHVAETEDFWLHAIVRGELEQPPDYALDDHPTHADIRRVLDTARERTARAFGDVGPDELRQPVRTPWGDTPTLEWVLWHVLEHEIHHRGELSLCLGLLGREGLDV